MLKVAIVFKFTRSCLLAIQFAKSDKNYLWLVAALIITATTLTFKLTGIL